MLRRLKLFEKWGDEYEKNSRKFIGIEENEEYIEISKRRLEKEVCI